MKFYIDNLCAWAPGIADRDEWKLWSHGDIEIKNEKISPKIEFTDPLFRRRFSQITKMTIQVVYDLLEERPDARDMKIIFSSFRGEIEREFSINKMLIEEKMILPAAFSLSVFNASIAAATIALQIKNGYTVVFPSKGNFRDALLSAAASVICGDQKEVVFVHADEKIPEQYGNLADAFDCTEPVSFACIISSTPGKNSIEFDSEVFDSNVHDFLKILIGGQHE